MPADLEFTHTASSPNDREMVSADDRLSTSKQEIEQHETRNLAVLCVHHVLMRMAWIFKTESVIMPAFLDSIAGAGWIRGCLPVLNRIGQSVPPLFFANHLSLLRYKKRALLVTSLCMAAPFLLLSTVWFLLAEKKQFWLPVLFLGLYLLFFSMTGLNQLSFGTIQGKLIRVIRRGRLMGISTTIGAVLAISCAAVLLSRWLKYPDGGYGWIFGFAGLGFVAAGLACWWLWEPRDEPPQSKPRRRHPFSDAWQVVKTDGAFRWLVLTSMMFMSSMLLFPHYQALARERLDSQPKDLMYWVITQNAGAGLFGLVSGWFADRVGNRWVVRVQIFGAALVPIAALILTELGELPWYAVTFFLLGLVPVTIRTLNNYTLELTDRLQHPRYLSTLRIGMAIPVFLAPGVGRLIDLVGFAPIFLTVAGLIALGGMMTLRLHEPRTENRSAELVIESAAE